MVSLVYVKQNSMLSLICAEVEMTASGLKSMDYLSKFGEIYGSFCYCCGPKNFAAIYGSTPSVSTKKTAQKELSNSV